MKIKSTALNQLIVMRAQIEAEIYMRVSKECVRLIEAIGKSHASSNDKVGPARVRKQHRLKGRKLPPRFRNPKNPAETWAGRGNRPRWLSSALAAGKKLEAFAI